MLKENEYILGKLNVALDWLVAALALLIVHFLRNYILGPFIVPEVFRFRSLLTDYWWLAFFLPTITVMVLGYYGHYRTMRTRPWNHLLGAHLLATTSAGLAAAVLSFALTPRGGGGGVFGIFTQEFVSRGVLLLFVPVCTVLLQIKEAAMRFYLQRLRGIGLNVQNLLLVGDLDAAGRFMEVLRRHPRWGYRVVGLISNEDNAAEAATESVQIPVLGRYNDLFSCLENHVVDDVVFLGTTDTLETLAPLMRGCEEIGVRSRLPLLFMTNRIARASLDTFDNVPVVSFNPVREFGAALFIKYTLDRVAALILLIVLSPLFLVVVLAIKFTSSSWKHPAFYGQTRCGLHGRQFTLWKFRSMIPDAEQRKGDLESRNEMTGPVFKIKDDPRITAVGKWLRRTSLDELPQLWNVLRGEMSLVGPRPPLPEEVQRYDRWQRRRLSMKPGMTCIWQVSGRNRLTFEEWMAMDLEYIDNWSLQLDIRILARTIYVVITGYGAM